MTTRSVSHSQFQFRVLLSHQIRPRSRSTLFRTAKSYAVIVSHCTPKQHSLEYGGSWKRRRWSGTDCLTSLKEARTWSGYLHQPRYVDWLMFLARPVLLMLFSKVSRYWILYRMIPSLLGESPIAESLSIVTADFAPDQANSLPSRASAANRLRRPTSSRRVLTPGHTFPRTLLQPQSRRIGPTPNRRFPKERAKPTIRTLTASWLSPTI